MDIEHIVFLIVLIGCGYTSWRMGVQEGSERTVDILHTMKIISFDNNGDIVPYKKS